jgi:ABC-2 type transport system ATP-binding protein
MLRLQGLRKAFGTLVAVDDLSLEIGRGEVFGLLGPNGAGKSTTIAMTVGLTRPDAGTVDLGGKGSPEKAEVRRLLGVAPQSLAIYDDLTARENLHLFGSLFGLRGTNLRRRCDEALELVSLAPRAGDRVKNYSGGMKRRLNFAGALLHDPPLLLLDEPTAGVDPQSRNSILDLVRSLASKGKTVVYTTHYMEEAAKVCDRVGIIDHGKLLALGTVAELISLHGGRSVITVTRASGEERLDSTDPMRDVARLLAPDATGEPVASIHVDRPDLESVFLSLTGRRLRE